MSVIFAQSDATSLPLADDSVDLTFTSPPYMDARTYGIGAQRECSEWVDWMVGVVSECVRVTRGLVIVNCAGVTRDWCYWPGCEGLLYEWWRRGGRCWRPCYWRRVGIPGSGGKQWYRADVEYLLAFTKATGPIEWAEPTANGHAPKWGPGGEMSHRLGSGARVNELSSRFPEKRNDRIVRRGLQCGGGSRRPDGTVKQGGYGMPAKANPGNVVSVKVGGGQMGSPLAHENEAPFPEALPAYFIRSHCKPGGIVLDPFSGSGTTVAAAVKSGRRGIGLDLRMSQCELGRRRVDSECGLFAVGGAA